MGVEGYVTPNTGGLEDLKKNSYILLVVLALSTAPHNRVSEILLSAHHSREGGNPDVVGKPLDPRLRGGDGTTNWALY
jgi:hypothetical protein